MEIGGLKNWTKRKKVSGAAEMPEKGGIKVAHTYNM